MGGFVCACSGCWPLVRCALCCIFSVVSWAFWQRASQNKMSTSRASKPAVLSTMRTYARGLLTVCQRRRMKLQTSLILYRRSHELRRRLRTRFLRIVCNKFLLVMILAVGVHGRHCGERVFYICGGYGFVMMVIGGSICLGK